VSASASACAKEARSSSSAWRSAPATKSGPSRRDDRRRRSSSGDARRRQTVRETPGTVSDEMPGEACKSGTPRARHSRPRGSFLPPRTGCAPSAGSAADRPAARAGPCPAGRGRRRPPAPDLASPSYSAQPTADLPAPGGPQPQDWKPPRAGQARAVSFHSRRPGRPGPAVKLMLKSCHSSAEQSRDQDCCRPVPGDARSLAGRAQLAGPGRATRFFGPPAALACPPRRRADGRGEATVRSE
jgi:hypothetical protein